MKTLHKKIGLLALLLFCVHLTYAETITEQAWNNTPTNEFPAVMVINPVTFDEGTVPQVTYSKNYDYWTGLTTLTKETTGLQNGMYVTMKENKESNNASLLTIKNAGIAAAGVGVAAGAAAAYYGFGKNSAPVAENKQPKTPTQSQEQAPVVPAPVPAPSMNNAPTQPTQIPAPASNEQQPTADQKTINDTNNLIDTVKQTSWLPTFNQVAAVVGTSLVAAAGAGSVMTNSKTRSKVAGSGKKSSKKLTDGDTFDNDTNSNLKDDSKLPAVSIDKNDKQPTTIFCHGLGGGQEREMKYLTREGILQQPATNFSMGNSRSDAGLGRGPDLLALENKAYEYENAPNGFILYGLSRGGSTAINYVAHHNPTKLHALILDAAPADMINVIEDCQYIGGALKCLPRSAKEYGLRLRFPEYPENATPPVNMINGIDNKKLPVLIAHSRTDSLVNIRSAWQNYKAFKEAGFDNVYLYELPKGVHEKNAGDLGYRQILHSFYKAFRFKYDPKLAIYNKSNLVEFQPSINQINDKLEGKKYKEAPRLSAQNLIEIESKAQEIESRRQANTLKMPGTRLQPPKAYDHQAQQAAEKKAQAFEYSKARYEKRAAQRAENKDRGKTWVLDEKTGEYVNTISTEDKATAKKLLKINPTLQDPQQSLKEYIDSDHFEKDKEIQKRLLYPIMGAKSSLTPQYQHRYVKNKDTGAIKRIREYKDEHSETIGRDSSTNDAIVNDPLNLGYDADHNVSEKSDLNKITVGLPIAAYNKIHDTALSII